MPIPSAQETSPVGAILTRNAPYCTSVELNDHALVSLESFRFEKSVQTSVDGESVVNLRSGAYRLL